MESKFGLNYEKNWKKMITVLRHLRRCCSKYLIIPEVSDAGKLHCHGWICIKDKIKWKKSVRRSIAKHGFIKELKIHNNSSFFTRSYYSKEIEESISLMIDFNIILFGHLNEAELLRYLRIKDILLAKECHPQLDITHYFSFND